MIPTTSSSLMKTGIIGLDEILKGGIPKKRIYLLQGEPGTGKTTLAFQFLMEGIKNKETCLYISFSESQEELQSVVDSHNWNIEKINMLELGSIEEQLKPESQNTVFYPSEVEMNQTTKVVYEQVEKIKPDRIVFDSISEMRMLADSSLKYRRQMLAFKQFFARKNVTVLLLDDLTATAEDLQVQSIVHGVFNLVKLHPDFGEERRRLNIVKLRGINYTGGFHDYVIRKGGIHLFPRMMSANFGDIKPATCTYSSGINGLDSLLGGGLTAGTSTLFLGPAGTGKSTLSLLYAYAAAERGEKAAIYAFEEGLNTLILRAESLGLDVTKHLKSGMLHIQKVDPAQLSPGEFTYNIKELVSKNNFKVVVIDSLNGYLHAMPQEQFLTLQLHELLAYLNSQGIVTVMVLAQQGMLGNMSTPIDLTYLADTVIITRYFEAKGSVRKAVSVIKQRAGLHEATIRELCMSEEGVKVGGPLTNFQGILTGVPQFIEDEHVGLS